MKVVIEGEIKSPVPRPATKTTHDKILFSLFEIIPKSYFPKQIFTYKKSRPWNLSTNRASFGKARSPAPLSEGRASVVLRSTPKS